jgi:hypothetical protein
MEPLADYLQIPAAYLAAVRAPGWSPAIGTLRWAESGEAVESQIGGTFVLGPELALFLEGFAAERQAMHFGFVLHFLHLLCRPVIASDDDFAGLAQAFTQTGRRFRNAGVLAARLCAGVPDLPRPIAVDALCRCIASPALMGEVFAVWWLRRRQPPGERPPLTPQAFEQRLREALHRIHPRELEHWLRHGRGSADQAAESVARAVADRPLTLTALLVSLAARERFGSALHLVPQLAGALSLPPRPLDIHELPLGGYSDLTNRGQPEQILPSQFALEPMEFLRRFAERELLYYRREEPRQRTGEELVVLLDQGVRTWGDVRLVLSAAVLALGKGAVGRQVRFQLAATSSGGAPSDPLKTPPAELAKCLEASDLTANPGAALQRVLREPASLPRDVVILTHPRNLHEADVAAAARDVPAGTRLFAVGVDGHGEVQLAEMRQGAAVPLSRLRVDLADRPARAPARSVPPSVAWAALPWQGDVEPIGYPFRFGLAGRLMRFDFDAHGTWLLLAHERGMLQAWRTDGSASEVLPRGFVDGRVLTQIDAVRGVTGGFVVAGHLGDHLILIHYDMARRTAIAYARAAGPRLSPAGWIWYYFGHLHAAVARAPHVVSANPADCVWAVDLATGAQAPTAGQSPYQDAERAEFACAEAQRSVLPPPSLTVIHRREQWSSTIGPAIEVDAGSGIVRLHGIGFECEPFCPRSDGKPVLKHAGLVQARCADRTLATVTKESAPSTLRQSLILRLFHLPEGRPMGEWPLDWFAGLALSADGRLAARQVSRSRVAAWEATDASTPRLVNRPGRYHNHLIVWVGPDWIAASIRRSLHWIDWSKQALSLMYFPNADKSRSESLVSGMGARPPIGRAAVLPTTLAYDQSRFVRTASEHFVVAVDCFGQIAVLDLRTDRLACMFFIYRGQIAAWLPDGTRYGPASLIGGPSTPGALERIAEALRAASIEGSTPT